MHFADTALARIEQGRANDFGIVGALHPKSETHDFDFPPSNLVINSIATALEHNKYSLNM